MHSQGIEKLKAGFALARDLTKKYARTFYFASLFLPRPKQDAAYAVYAICHITDETVDDRTQTNKAQNLTKLKTSINEAYGQNELKTPLLAAFQVTVKQYDIPSLYFNELTSGIEMDLTKARYENFEELHPYCYKVAGVVGLIMLKIFGCKDKEAQQYAANLGVAMQLTNVTRDIKEDFERGRIYLPRDEMSRFNVSEEDIAHHRVTENFKSLLQFQINRARKYYATTTPGIHLIQGTSSRIVVLTIHRMYARILNKIEKMNYDVFSHRARVSFLEKCMIAAGVILRGEYL